MIIPPSTMIAIYNNEDDDINAMKKIDDEYFEKNNKYLYWNTLFMASRIKSAMEEEINPLLPTKWNTLWYSLRLKFTDNVIRKEAINFLNGNFDYRREIYGYKIYDIMKEYEVSYPVALLQIYTLINNGKDESEYTLKRQITDYHVPLYTKSKIAYSILNENGTIEYFVPEKKQQAQKEIDKHFEELEKEMEKIHKKMKNNPPKKRRFE